MESVVFGPRFDFRTIMRSRFISSIHFPNTSFELQFIIALPSQPSFVWCIIEDYRGCYSIESPSFTVASFPIAPNGAHDYFLQQQDLNINIPSRLSDFADSPGHIKSFRHLPLLRRQSTRSVQSTCEQ